MRLASSQLGHPPRQNIHMYRQLIPRSTRLAIVYPGSHAPIAHRKMATTPPRSSQGQSGSNQTPSPDPGGSNTLIVLSALAALGGLYYYYTRGQPAVDRETARLREEETKKKVREEGAAKQGQREYNQAKAAAQDAATTARTRTTEARTELTERARQGAHEAQAKLDELKNTAERTMSDVRDRSEKKIEKGKEEVVRQAHNAEDKTRRWFGWGSSK